MALYKMTAIGIKRICIDVEAESVADAHEKIKEQYLSLASALPMMVDTYQGDVAYFQPPSTLENRIKETYGYPVKFDFGLLVCGNCDAELEEMSKYCPHCGKKVGKSY